jgi:hypothetical protein
MGGTLPKVTESPTFQLAPAALQRERAYILSSCPGYPGAGKGKGTMPSDSPPPSAAAPKYESIEESARYYASLGEWVTPQAVMNYCHITADTLREWRVTNRVLGAEFNDGNFYYPTAQFRDGRVAPGLSDVLAVLSRGFRANATRIAWFAGRAYVGEAIARWDLLRAGEVSLLIEWAKQDVARITAR